MKPLRWRYCSHCGFGGGLGKVKSIKRVCKNMRCVKFGKTLEIGSMKDADLIRKSWRLIPAPANNWEPR